MLGAAAAQRLGIDRIYPGERIWVDNQWFYVVGILNPAVLAPEIDSSVLVGFPAAENYLGFDGHPSTIYVRAQTDQVNAVDSVLAATANPENPSEVDVSQPSAALVAQADAKGAFNGLFLGLGAVSLLVGAVGVANIMVICVLERRSEIGLRRALGATKGHIRIQFLSEAVLLALIGGAVGVGLGVAATAIYATPKHGRRRPRPRLGRRLRRRPAHRRGRRAPPRPARRPHVTHRSAVDRMSRADQLTAALSAGDPLGHSNGSMQASQSRTACGNDPAEKCYRGRVTHKPRPMMILTGERQLGQRLSPNPRPLAWGHDSEGSGAVVLISANTRPVSLQPATSASRRERSAGDNVTRR